MNDFSQDYKTAFDLGYDRQKSYEKRNVTDHTKHKHMDSDIHNLPCSTYSYSTQVTAKKYYLEGRKARLILLTNK